MINKTIHDPGLSNIYQTSIPLTQTASRQVQTLCAEISPRSRHPPKQLQYYTNSTCTNKASRFAVNGSRFPVNGNAQVMRKHTHVGGTQRRVAWPSFCDVIAPFVCTAHDPIDWIRAL
jgi:hypothetical protein